MSHPDYDALLAGVLADPDADLPRLVLADWLEETGHPANCARAEYIRLAIEICSDRAQTGHARWECDNVLDSLKQSFRDEWDSFAARIEVGVSCERQRGFVSFVGTSDTNMRLFDAKFIEGLPFTVLRISLSSIDANLVIQFPQSRTVRGVHIYTAGGVHRPARVLEIVDFPSAKSVVLSGNGIADAELVTVVHAIGGNKSLQGLETLNVGNNPVSDFGAHALAAAEWPPTLRSLSIYGTRITNAGRAVLFKRFGFEELRPVPALG